MLIKCIFSINEAVASKGMQYLETTEYRYWTKKYRRLMIMSCQFEEYANFEISKS